MVVDNRTGNRDYPLPDLSNKQRVDILRIISALTAIDVDVAAFLQALAGKAALSHQHAMGDVTGLADALAGKMAANRTFALDDLSDVGAAGAANGMVLKRVGAAWTAARVLLGDIEGWEATVSAMLQSAVSGLVNGSPASLDTLRELAAALGDDPNFATTMSNALGNRLRFDAAQTLSAGQRTQALTNLGAIAAIRNFILAANTGAALQAIGAQASLGFTPSRQRGGNIVELEWVASWMSLAAVIDSTSLGRIWTDYSSGWAPGETAQTTIKLPTGAMAQAGNVVVSTNGGGDASIGFYENFAVTPVVTVTDGDAQGGPPKGLGVWGAGPGNFIVRAFNHDGTPHVGNIRIMWHAQGRRI